MSYFYLNGIATTLLTVFFHASVMTDILSLAGWVCVLDCVLRPTGEVVCCPITPFLFCISTHEYIYIYIQINITFQHFKVSTIQHTQHVYICITPYM